MPWLLLAILIVPAIEIGVFIWVGSYIGPLWIVVLILLTGILGITLAKRQGMETLRRAQVSMANGQIPGEQIIEGICILVGGIFLLAPGFVTDSIGLFLVIPFTRRLVLRWFKDLLRKMIGRKTIIFRRW